jgi:L-threonylcarbamoyladenylate synthase
VAGKDGTDAVSTRVRRTERLTADRAGIARAAALLREGGLVAFPTETVYGLGADATRGEAVAGIYGAKERPRFNPLIVHVPDLSTALGLAHFDERALTLAASFWPGPLTLVLPALDGGGISDLARAGLASIALRVPAHPTARRLLEDAGRPVAAPSANRSGRVSPTTADHVLADLEGRIDAVLDDGATQVGVESTILACLDGELRLLRPGGVTRMAIERALGMPVAVPPAPGDEAPLAPGDEAPLAPGDEAPLAPGMLASHYAPAARVRLDARTAAPGEAWLGFGAAPVPPGVAAQVNLSPTGDLAEAAAGLFAALRLLDASGAATIAVAPVPNEGLGEAINDRLSRAAAPR